MNCSTGVEVLSDINRFACTERLWTKNYVLILVNYFLIFLVHFALLTTLPLYIVSIGGDNSTAGSMTTLYMVSSILLKPFIGLGIDRFGRKIVLCCGMVLMLLVSIAYNFNLPLENLYILRFINGIAFGTLLVVTGTMVVDSIPASRLAEGVGFSGISLTTATALGPALGEFVIKKGGGTLLFESLLIVTILSFLCTLFIKCRKVIPCSDGQISVSFYEKSALKPSVLLLFISLGVGSISTFIIPYSQSRGIGSISFFFFVYAFTALISRIWSGKIADRKGASYVLVPAMFALFISYMLLSFAFTLKFVILAGVLYGFGYGIVIPCLNVIMMKSCPPSRRGVATAMLFSAMDLGVGAGAFIWGWISVVSGFTLVYFLSSLTVAAAIAIYYILFREK